MRCVSSHDGYGCKRGLGHVGVHVGLDGHAWTDEESWGYNPDNHRTTLGDVMCTLCGLAGTVETDTSKPEAMASAVAWAAHFATAHPGIDGPPSRHIVAKEAS